jgi:glycosyltransferase involved in cell wall biosynthesis
MMASDNPTVTVLMSVYNGEKYLAEAIESILSQTYDDFEFLIIDDCSTDESANIIHSFKDEKIVYKKNRTNIGQTKSLNKGIKLANGEYIARIDQDDESNSTRLEKQLSFLKENNCHVVGSWFNVINSNGELLYKNKLPVEPQDIINLMTWSNPIAHSSAMIKKDELISLNSYPEHYTHGMDMALWIKFVQNNYKIMNIPEYLINWRQHNQSSSKNPNNLILNLCEEIELLNISKNMNADNKYKKINLAFTYYTYIFLFFAKIRSKTFHVKSFFRILNLRDFIYFLFFAVPIIFKSNVGKLIGLKRIY